MVSARECPRQEQRIKGASKHAPMEEGTQMSWCKKDRLGKEQRMGKEKQRNREIVKLRLAA